jgi:hypothetical protein
MDAAENAKNLEAIQAARAKTIAVAATPSDKQTLIEIAIRMVEMARKIPTPGVTDTYTWSKVLAEDARTIGQIAEKLQ